MLKYVLLLLAIPPLAAAADADLIAAYAQLRNIQLDPAHVAVVEGLELKKDAATFQFKSGTLYVFQPVLNKVAGAVFIGEGVLTFQPPAQIEQEHLSRFTNGEPRLEEAFKEAVLLFTDSTFADFSRSAAFKPGTVDSKAARILSDFHKTFREDLKMNVDARLLAGLCSDRQSLFLADLHGQRHGDLLFMLDPMTGESESLIHYGSRVFDTWVSLNPAGWPSLADRTLVDTTRVDLDTQVDKGGKLQAVATTEFTALQNGPRMLYVQLAGRLRVSKASAADGAALKYIQEDEDKDSDFWVILPTPLAKGAKHSWKIDYGGDGVVQKAGNGNYFVGARDRWYPKPDVPGEAFNDRALYHMLFHSPKELTLVATGKPIRKTQEAKITVSEWETESPYTVVGFNYGEYKTKTYKKGDQEITVYANEQLGNELNSLKLIIEQNPGLERQLGITTGGFNTTGIMGNTLADVANALNLFTVYFGPLPFKNFSITQQPSSVFGQSWPTLIFMPYTSFLDANIRHQLKLDVNRRSRQFFEEVSSHEVSHQWWGHMVGWSSYRDQWLSEGFAQFSAGLFVQRTKGDKEFRNFLDADREFITAPLPNTTMRANDAGPIALGTRLDTDKTEGASRLIYAKGAFVLHMLRMMMYDYAQSDDRRFIAMMRDFVQSYADKSASTADFKAICDKHFGADMGWFFDQWVYGTAIPKISVEYGVKDALQGPVLAVDVKQQNVPEGFRSVLPFVMRAGGSALSATLTISKPTLHVEVPLKQKPESVEFNPLFGLLCDLEVKKR